MAIIAFGICKYSHSNRATASSLATVKKLIPQSKCYENFQLYQ